MTDTGSAHPLDQERATALARVILDAWTRQDVASVIEHYTEDLAYADPNTPEPIRGRAAFSRYLERLFSEWTLSWSLREAYPFADGAGAQILWTGTFRHRAGGATTSIDGMDLVLLDGDRIRRNDVVFDRSKLPGAGADALRLVQKSWLTHDAMWLRAAIAEVGIEQANRLNLRAVRDAAAVEAKRVLGTMGLERVETVEQLDAFLRRARTLLVGDVLDGEWTVEPPGVLRMRVGRCFAEAGVSRLGLLDRYECGIYERVRGWLDGLGLAHTVSPDTRACTKGGEAHCARVMHFELPGGGARSGAA
jgi:ketosteroid isomerase-like protein